ncbi:hypothetical protein OG474_40160 [Kribbella sp. NBC_01505]|uniref:DUF6882 domain-containing protein n=1 Tax=Kribbella sp. NBC_01505 TaxID=2903580 RepID=UPI0038699BDB
MGLFKKKVKQDNLAANAELAQLLLEGEDMLQQLQVAHLEGWGLGSADSWGLDQTTGLLTWTFPDKVATAPAQILGSYSHNSGSWMWAWANQSILPEMSRDSLAVREWAEAGGHHSLAEPSRKADDSQVASLTAIAVRVTRAAGYYRGPGGSGYTVMTFGPVTLTAADGTTSSFAIDVQ